MRILRGLSSKGLPCGCVAGVYETYDALIVTIIDAKGTGCGVQSHREGKIVPEKSTEESPAHTNLELSRRRSLTRD